jgi:uncharacterized membrane protein YgcG
MRTRRAALAAACALALGSAADAQTPRTLEFPSFHTDLLVHRDGTVTVTENIRVHFIGTWNGLLREIPIEYRTDLGANYTLLLDIESVTDSAGAELRWESERTGANRRFRIWVPGASDATRTVVLRYRVRNGLRFFEEHDELYWSVTGNDSEFPIHVASATVHVPPEATSLRATAFTGPRGAVTSDADVDITANRVAVRTTRGLGFREGLTIAVGWDPGVVARPTATQRAARFLLANGFLAAPLLAAFVMTLLWRRFGRDPEERSVVPRYEPPAGMTPAEAGTLIDESPDLRDVTATLVDMAVRGFILIEETEQKKFFGLSKERTFSFRSLRPAGAWADLKPHERALLEALFDGGRRDEVATEDLENVFYEDLPAIQSSLGKILVSDGHYLHHPTNVRVAWLLAGIATGIVIAVVGSVLVMRLLGQQPLAPIIGGVLAAVVIAGFGLVMPARTRRGARALEEIRGFEEFLRRVEKDRFERVIRSPELFERYLPYAMAFGVERNWARAFDDIYREPPDWYRGAAYDGSFHAALFTSNLNRMSTVTGAAMTAAPRSSASSSGFGGGGGGGFSGGGFGGGSVGGF